MKQSSIHRHGDSSRDVYIEGLRAQYLQGTLHTSGLERRGPLPRSLLSAILPHLFPEEIAYS